MHILWVDHGEIRCLLQMLQLRVNQRLLLSFAARGGHSAPSTILLGELPLNKDNFHPFGNHPHTILPE